MISCYLKFSLFALDQFTDLSSQIILNPWGVFFAFHLDPCLTVPVRLFPGQWLGQ